MLQERLRMLADHLAEFDTDAAQTLIQSLIKDLDADEPQFMDTL
jgi:hypothetical protein